MVVGTPIGDTFVVTDTYVAGAGRIVTFTAVEAVEVDGAGGPDDIYVLATGDAFETVITGGSGDDTIHVGGDPPTLVFDPPPFTYTPPPFERAAAAGAGLRGADAQPRQLHDVHRACSSTSRPAAACPSPARACRRSATRC